jgi:hypothetical protein
MGPKVLIRKKLNDLSWVVFEIIIFVTLDTKRDLSVKILGLDFLSDLDVFSPVLFAVQRNYI